MRHRERNQIPKFSTKFHNILFIFLQEKREFDFAMGFGKTQYNNKKRKRDGTKKNKNKK